MLLLSITGDDGWWWLDSYFWRKKNWTNGAGCDKARVFPFSADQQLLCYGLEIQLMTSGNIWIYVLSSSKLKSFLKP